MLTYAPAALKTMREICSRHRVLFIADEVMTGFGRTGTMFAMEQAGVSPDILCLAKGLTGGALPLAVTLCTSEIFDAHLSKDRARTFFHSSSYTANAIACAAAGANLEIWKSEPVPARVQSLEKAQTNELAKIRKDDRFANARQLGTIAAFELAQSENGYLANVALTLRQKLLDRGVLLRPLGNTIYVMPPYCTTADELASAYAAISAGVDEVAP
jgi:adenosylmethionine-8-amino-7-oxononanoate aminotransferase